MYIYCSAYIRQRKARRREAEIVAQLEAVSYICIYIYLCICIYIHINICILWCEGGRRKSWHSLRR